MSSKNIVIDLRPRPDRDGKIIYIGKVKAPVLIDCSLGVTFLIFVSDSGDEQLQIALMDDGAKDAGSF